MAPGVPEQVLQGGLVGEPGGGVIGEVSASLTSWCDAVNRCRPLGPRDLSPQPVCGPACKGRRWAVGNHAPSVQGVAAP